MKMKLSFKYDKGVSFEENLDELNSKVLSLIGMYMSTKTDEYRAYMKANRKWTDRTNMAKGTLNARLSKPDENTFRITLSHGVMYGMWLELANQGKYAIVIPTIKLKGPELINDLQDIFNRLKI